jgi:large conductance mechanosensitive channel
VIIAAVVYYLIVAPVTKVTGRLERNKIATHRDCPECLSEIPVGATRCLYCTAVVRPEAPGAPPAR